MQSRAFQPPISVKSARTRRSSQITVPSPVYVAPLRATRAPQPLCVGGLPRTQVDGASAEPDDRKPACKAGFRPTMRYSARRGALAQLGERQLCKLPPHSLVDPTFGKNYLVSALGRRPRRACWRPAFTMSCRIRSSTCASATTTPRRPSPKRTVTVALCFSSRPASHQWFRFPQMSPCPGPA